MALPTLDATFASSVDLPRRQMLARWLVEELGSGSIADYYDLPERYLWAKIAVAAGGPKDEAAYIGLPKQYAWKDIYDAVSGSSLGTIDWVEKQALGHIAAAYRGDTGIPANLATYIDWPWRYQVAAIIDGVGPAFPSAGLLAFWKLADLTDASGNGSTLTNTNSVTFGAGKIGNAAVFDGSNYLRSTINVLFDLAFCISLWCKPDDVGDYGVMFGGDTAGTINMAYTGANSFDFNNGSVAHINVAGTPSVWQHLVFNSDGTADQAWVNGVLVDTQGAQGRSPTLSIDLGTLTDSAFYYGKLDAVGVWNRPLTNGEITQLYNNGNGLEP